MTLPTLSVRIAFATNPLDTPTWTDVSAYVRGLRIRRGRNDELGRMEAGEAEVVLDNRDRRFDPTHAAGPYYPNVLPMRKISIRATWNAVTYDVYTGFIEAWPTAWPLSTDSTVTLTCADAFMYFALVDWIAVSFSASSAKDMINDILTFANWPPLDRSIDDSITTMQAWSATQEPIFGWLQRLTDSENGFLWIGADGTVYFRERHYRLTHTASNTSQATFGDSGVELPYTAIAPTFDQTYIRNDVIITRTGGVAQEAADTTSFSQYFRRKYTKTDLLMPTDSEALAAATWVMTQYKDPALRFRSITINPQVDNTNLWPQALGRDFHDRITVKRRPPGGGSAISQDCWIEGVEHTVDVPNNTWLTSWNLSPANQAIYWILGSSTMSVLGSTTILAY